jgi:hypothetical protein
MDEQADKLVEDATAGLRSDPELRLDVRKELLSHLERTAENFCAEGCEDAEEQARKTFGSPLELAGELLEGNKRRMRFRALARLFVGALLVPLAVVVALYLGYGGLARQAILLVNLNNSAMEMPYYFGQFKLPMPPGGLYPSWQQLEKQLDTAGIIQGHNQQRFANQAKRQWEAHRNSPDEPMYFAYYTAIRHITLHPRRRGETMPSNTDTRAYQQWQQREAAFAEFEQEMRLGERLEPDNALYAQKLAWAYLNVSMRSKEEQPQPAATDELYDQQLFDQAVAELHRLYGKSALRAYHLEMVRERIDRLPEPRYIEQYLVQTSMWAHELLPEYSQMRSTARQICGVQRLLAAQGWTEEAEFFMRCWWTLPTQVERGSDNLIGVLSANAIARVLGESTANLYDDMGRPADAARVRGELARFISPIQTRREGRRNQSPDQNLKLHGGLLVQRYANSKLFDPPPVADLRPSRLYEYNLLEQLMLSIVLLFFSGFLIVAALAGFVWLRRLREGRSAPFLLLPGWRDGARVVLLGLAVPTVLYLLYTWSPLGGRQYGLPVNWPRFTIEVLAMMAILLHLPERLMRDMVHRRCRALGVAVPKAGFSLSLLAVPFLLATAFGIYYMARIMREGGTGNLAGDIVNLLFSVLPLPVICIVAVSLPMFGYYLIRRIIGTRRPRTVSEYALYRGTLARSLVPVYAAAVILLGGLVQPYLLHREASLLRQDRCLFNRFDGGRMPMEVEAVQKIKSEVLQVAEELERERE